MMLMMLCMFMVTANLICDVCGHDDGVDANCGDDEVENDRYY